MDVLQQSTNLTAGFITYLQRKQAAGIVNVAPPGHQQVYTHYYLLDLPSSLYLYYDKSDHSIPTSLYLHGAYL